MTFDPFEKRWFTDKEVTQLFGPKSDSKLAARTAKENPELYEAVRAQAVTMNFVGERGVSHAKGKITVHVMSPKAGPTVHSDEDLRLMILYPKSVCDLYYRDNKGDTSRVIAKLTVEEQVDLRNAGLLHGTLSPGVVNHRKPEVEPVVADDMRVEAGILASVAGISPSERVTPSQYNFLLQAKTRLDEAKSPAQRAQDRADAAKQSAADAQAAADKLAAK